MRSSQFVTVLVPWLVACGGAASHVASTTAAEPEIRQLASRSIALPGGPGVRMDFIAYDAATHGLWVPAGSTGRVDVIDVATDSVAAIDGFATNEIDSPRGRRVVGPSSVAIGDGVAYVGNRGDNRVCAVDTSTRTVAGCAQLDSMPDAMVLVSSRDELWVTTPRTQSIAVLHVGGTASPPSVLATFALDGDPECFTLDAAHGVVFTNLEDRDRTLAIDASSRQVTSTWEPGCGDAGPRGLAFDGQRRLLYVACTDHVAALDIDHDGAVVSTAATGGGVDDISFFAPRGLLYVGSGADALLRVVQVDERGALSIVATAATSAGARNAVVDETGRAYLADSQGGRIWVVDAP